MAQGVVGLILRARDEATATIRRVNAELGGITRVAGKLSGAFGLGGLGVSAMLAAGAAVVTLAESYAKAVEEQNRLGLTMGMTRAEFSATEKSASEFTVQLERMKRGWKEFTEETGKRSLDPAATSLGILNAIGRSISAGRWKEFFGLLMEGPMIYKQLEDAHRKEIDASDKAAAAQERERAAAEKALAAARARAQRIEDLARTMRVARTEATFLLELLDRLDRQKSARQIQQRVFEGLGGEGDVGDVSPGAIRPRGSRRFLMPQIDRPEDFDFAAREREIKALLESMPRISAEAVILRETWSEIASESLKATRLMRDAFDSFATGVESGMAGIASRFGDKTQTIRGAWSTLIHSIEQEFYQMAARIAARQLINIVAGIVFPGAGAAAAAGSKGGPALPSSLRRLPRGTAAPTVVYNVYIQSYTPKDVEAAALSPSGAVRAANAQIRKLRRAGQD